MRVGSATSGAPSVAWWPELKTMLDEARLSVSEHWSDAAAAKAAVIPGTTSRVMPASRNASISSAARPKTSGSPLLRRTTDTPCDAFSIMSRLISACVVFFVPQRLPTFTVSARENCRRNQIVMKNDVRSRKQPNRLDREQLGIAGPGADQVHLAGLLLGG